MKNASVYLLNIPLLALLLTSCAARFPKWPEKQPSELAEFKTTKLLEGSIARHGGDVFEKVDDLSVSYDGEWARIVKRLQPVLVDAKYRKSSQERIVFDDRQFENGFTIGQAHLGPKGEKHVFRRNDLTRVWFDLQYEKDPEKVAAAALVADAYTMFITGPSFFRHFGEIDWRYLGEKQDRGETYELLYARMRPGFGEAKNDDIILWLRQRDFLLWRVEFTLNGLRSTRGAFVDVTFGSHFERGGFVWPGSFLERVRRPVRVKAHEWYTTGLDLNRGLDERDLWGPVLSPEAAPPARALPNR